MKILFCGEEFPVARRSVEALLPGDEMTVCRSDRIIESLDGVDVLIPSMCPIGPEIIEAGSMRLIQQFGRGVEGIDLVSASQRGIPVANVPTHNTLNSESASELAIMHLLLHARHYTESQRTFAEGRLGEPVGSTLVGKTAVVLGLGPVGQAIARKLKPFGVTVIGVSQREQVDSPHELGLDGYLPLSQLRQALASAHVLMLALPLNEGTRTVIGAPEIAAMPPGGIVVNVARGGLIDYDALRSGLSSGQLAGAGLDVFWTEPFSADDPIFDERVTVTPHLGGVTVESYRDIAGGVVANIERLRRGEPVVNRVA